MTTEVDAPRFTNISQIKRANKDAGRFWFSPSTVKYFRSKVETRVYEKGPDLPDYPEGTRIWVESTRYEDDPREYKIARFNVESGDISWVSLEYRTLKFASLNAAEMFLTTNML